jgi:hypothetical protein
MMSLRIFVFSTLVEGTFDLAVGSERSGLVVIDASRDAAALILQLEAVSDETSQALHDPPVGLLAM